MVGGIGCYVVLWFYNMKECIHIYVYMIRGVWKMIMSVEGSGGAYLSLSKFKVCYVRSCFYCDFFELCMNSEEDNGFYSL